jgi:hypothetical protein
MAKGGIKPKDHVNYMEKMVQHPKHWIGKVIDKTWDKLTLLLSDKETEVTVNKDSVKIVGSAKEDSEYNIFLKYAPNQIKKMFDTFSPEEKKAYAQVAEFDETGTSFTLQEKLPNWIIQHTFLKISNTPPDLDDKLQAGYLEKHEEASYWTDYFASQKAREELLVKQIWNNRIHQNLWITPTLFEQLVKNMPAWDDRKLSTSSAAKFQAFISLGWKFSWKVQHAIVDNKPQYKKIPAEMDNLHLYYNQEEAGNDKVDRTLVCGYLALAWTDKDGKSRVVSAVKDKDEKPWYEHYKRDNWYAVESAERSGHWINQHDLIPFVTLTEPPIIRYKDGAGNNVDKNGNPV